MAPPSRYRSSSEDSSASVHSKEFPLATSHRDSCLRVIRLPKTQGTRLQRAYVWLVEREVSKPVLGSFLLLRLVVCFEEQKIYPFVSDLLHVRHGLLHSSTAATVGKDPGSILQVALNLAELLKADSSLTWLQDDEDDEDDEDEHTYDEEEVKKCSDFCIKLLDSTIRSCTVLAESWCDWGILWDTVSPSGSKVWELMGSAARGRPEKDDVTDRSPETQSIQLQRISWKIAIFRAHTLSTDAEQMPSRRQRLVAACGTMLLIGVLAGFRSAVDSGSSSEPKAKRQKQEDLIGRILTAANEEAAFTRWAAMGRSRIEPNITKVELKAEFEAVCKAVWETAAPQKTGALPEVETLENIPTWQKEFLKSLPKEVSPGKIIHCLPATADLMYQSAQSALSHNPLYAQAVVDESSLVELDSLDALCRTVDEPSSKSNVAVSSGGKNKNAAEIEKQVAEVLDDDEDEGVEKAKPFRLPTPAAITEAMEVNEWAVSILYMEGVQPSANLLDLLDEASEAGGTSWNDVIIPVLNRVALKLSQETMTEKPTRSAAISIDAEGAVGSATSDVTPDKQMCQAVVALYYGALEAMLTSETQRLSKQAHPRIVLQESFHRAVLSCCVIAVIKAFGVAQRLRLVSSLMRSNAHNILQYITESSPYDFLKVSEFFHHSLSSNSVIGKLGSPLVFPLPRLLRNEIKVIEIQLTDTLLWARDAKFVNSLPTRIDDFKEKTNACFWPPESLAPDDGDDTKSESTSMYPSPDDEDYAEYRSVSYIMRKILKIAYFRIQALCSYLCVPPNITLAHETWTALRFLMREHIEVFFDRHLDHWILCSLYGVSKALQYELTFSSIIDAYVVVRGQELGDLACQRIVRHAKLESADNDEPPVGNIIQLYNQIFVPKMKVHLLKDPALRRVSKGITAGTSDLLSPGPDTNENDATTPNIQLNALSPEQYLLEMRDRLFHVNGSGNTRTVLTFGSPQVT